MEGILVDDVEEIYSQLIEHLGDRFSPEEAVNKATGILNKYYLHVKEE